MGSGKTRWKLSFRHRSSPSSPSKSPPPPPPPPPPPMEFVCPISGSLMADPVILPSGQSLERACIQACLDLDLTPPIDLSSPFPSPSPSPPLTHLIPNVALKAAILHYCDSSRLPRPLPISTDAARDLVRGLLLNSSSSVPKNFEAAAGDAATPSKSGSRSGGGSSETMTPTTPPLSMPAKNCFSPPSTSSSSFHSSSSYSSSEIVVVSASDGSLTLNPTKSPTAAADPPVDSLEAEILAKLKDPQISEQEAALAFLRSATRESRDRRISLCTARLLAALRPMLLSRYSTLQTDAAASVVNLSLEGPNKVRIVRSGAVPPLVDVLKSGQPEARDHAAGALFSLVLDDENKVAIGVLGAIPPLLHLFSRPSDGPLRARRDAGMALYHLSLVGTNRSKLGRTPGAVQALLRVAVSGGADVPEGEAQPPPLPAKLALMIMCNLSGCAEGRAALMDAGAVAGVVELMRAGVAGPAEEHCVAVLYGMSKRSLRFRGLAKAAGAEEALMRVADGGEGEVRREMARRTLRAMRGEEEDDLVADEGGSVVSEGLVSFRRRYKDLGNVSGTNSAEF